MEGVAIVIVGLVQSLIKALISLIFVIVFQLLEGNLIPPQIMHPQTNFSSLATVVMIFAG